MTNSNINKRMGKSWKQQQKDWLGWMIILAQTENHINNNENQDETKRSEMGQGTKTKTNWIENKIVNKKYERNKEDR